MLLIVSIFPYFSLIAGGIMVIARGWAAAGSQWHWIVLLSAICISIQQTVIARFYRLSRANPWLTPTWIVGAVMCVGMLGNAMLKLKGRTQLTWRGTTY